MSHTVLLLLGGLLSLSVIILRFPVVGPLWTSETTYTSLERVALTPSLCNSGDCRFGVGPKTEEGLKARQAALMLPLLVDLTIRQTRQCVKCPSDVRVAHETSDSPSGRVTA